MEIKDHWKKNALVDEKKYLSMYKDSIENNENFWNQQGGRINWKKKYSKTKNIKYSSKDVSIKWYYDGTLNVSENCIDRHAKKTPNKIAIIWEGDDPSNSQKITYKELLQQVNKTANALKEIGVQKGDRVTIYLTMIPELAYVMLACARIGAIHSIIFGGFSADSIAGRILDCKSDFVVTADEGLRGGKLIPLKETVDKALLQCPNVKKCLIVKKTSKKINLVNGRDEYLDKILKTIGDFCQPEEMNAEDPLFILYTSGSTGKPKGVLHTSGGYLVYASMTHEYIFNYKPNDIYWCTADIGWVTGHSYIIYGPLANGATTLMFEGVPNYPSSSRFWEVIDKHQVNIFYTAPTVIRALMREGDEPVKKTSRKSLKLLGTVGEPINPEAWKWYYEVPGNSASPIVDTWWQTETGGHLLAPFPGCVDNLKPGAAMTPYFGIEPELYTPEGKLIEGEGEGLLCFSRSWPGQMQTVWGDHERFEATYFSMFKGKYFTGDGAKRDADGHIWITGPVDDVLNVSGHRIGTAEVESAIVEHPHVTEAAVVGYPHDVKGQGIYAFITLEHGVEASDDLKKEIVSTVRKIIGPIASPDVLLFTDNLPKTRSGKIMRRILRKIAADETDSLGDISTLADPEVVERIIEKHNNAK